MKMLGFSRIVQFGDMIPRGYGLAYYEAERDCAVFYPIPLNVIVRYAREAWYWVRIGGRPKSARMIADARLRGYHDGYKAALTNCRALADKETMKLYVWTDVLRDYTAGMAVVLARNPKELVEVMSRDFPEYIIDGLPLNKLKIVTKPEGFYVFGGG